VFTVSCLYICTHICKCHETCIYIHRERERKKETERERKREKEREKERGREREWEWYVYLYIHIYICIYGVLNIRCATAGWISREVSRIEPLIKTMRKANKRRTVRNSFFGPTWLSWGFITQERTQKITTRVPSGSTPAVTQKEPCLEVNFPVITHVLSFVARDSLELA